MTASRRDDVGDHAAKQPVFQSVSENRAARRAWPLHETRVLRSARP